MHRKNMLFLIKARNYTNIYHQLIKDFLFKLSTVFSVRLIGLR